MILIKTRICNGFDYVGFLMFFNKICFCNDFH